MQMFTFGDPEPALAGTMYDNLGVWLMDNGTYYEPPVPWKGVARLMRANAYHGPILEFKANLIMRGFIPSPALSRQTMRRLVMDYLVFANCYPQTVRNALGEVVQLRHLPAINMRRMREEDRYLMLQVDGRRVEFQPGEVQHLRNYAVDQDVYGVPFYLGGIQSMLLNEDATLFRRRYYKNGAHMGYVFYTSGQIDKDFQEKIEKAIEGSKGLGNFKNMYLHINQAEGRNKVVDILPVGDFSTKDELEKIKNISRDDIIAAHRMPPALAAIIPTNTAGFGDVTKINEVYHRNEVEPLRQDLLEVNDVLRADLRVGFEKEDEIRP